MSTKNRIAGLVGLTIDGEKMKVKGNVTYNLGQNKREAVVGHDSVHGYKELPQAPTFSCELTDWPSLSVVDKILNMTQSSLVINLANGKKAFFEEAFYTGDGNLESEDGKIQFEGSAMSADELTA